MTCCPPSDPIKLRYASSDWWPNMLKLHKSLILRRISSHLIFNVAVAGIVMTAHMRGFTWLSIPSVLHSLSAPVLSLLLVFRTNAAYDRWWEARKTWGKMYAVSRNFIRMAATYITDRRVLHRICSGLCAFPELMRQDLTRMDPASKPAIVNATCVSAAMCMADANTVLDSDRSALACCRVLGSAVHEAFSKPARPTDNSELASSFHAAVQLGVQRKNLETQVSTLSDCLGICERILKAPVPYSYSRHTSRFLTVWLGSMPLGLVPLVPPLWLPFLSLVMSWMFLSVEEIGHIIEEPFNVPGASKSTAEHPRTSLNMDVIADAIVCEVVEVVPDHTAKPINRWWKRAPLPLSR